MKVRIGLYPWEILFVDKERLKNSDGQTIYNDFQILIRDDLSPIATELVLRHEVVHALLGTQGRVFQRKFNVEEVCEFIAWKLPEINDVVENIMSRKER